MRKKVIAIGSVISLLFCYGLCSSFKSSKFSVNGITYKKVDFLLDDYLLENGYVSVNNYCVSGDSFYEAKVSTGVYEGGFHFDDSWKRIDDIDDYFGIAREVSCSYKVLSISSDNGKFVVNESVVDDIDPLSFVYVDLNDYIVHKYSDEFYVNKGKILVKR